MDLCAPACESSVTKIECDWESESPSGRLPCVDLDGVLLASSQASPTCIEEADYIISRLEDAGVFGRPRISEQTTDHVTEAMLCVLQMRVIPAVQKSIWSGTCYSLVTREMYGQGLPFPLSYLLPAAKQRTMQVGSDNSTLVRDGAKALKQIGEFIKNHPTPTDDGGSSSYRFHALLCACLCMIRCLPVSRVLRNAATPLDGYLDTTHRNVFLSERGAITASVVADKKWASVADDVMEDHGGGGRDADEDDEESSQAGTYWLGAVGALVAGYALFFLRGNSYIMIGDDDDLISDE